MEEVLLRRVYTDGATSGVLMFGTESMATLERPWLQNAHQISCIPEGRYLCEWGYMAHHQTHHYQLKDVPNRSAIFIHRGTYVADSQGCILLGRTYTNDKLTATTYACGALESHFQQAPFMLVITSATGEPK